MGKIKDLLCYDVASCPAGMSLDRVFHIMKTQNILLFSSTGVKSKHPTNKQNVCTPFIINKSKSNLVKLIDTDTEVGREILNNLTKI